MPASSWFHQLQGHAKMSWPASCEQLHSRINHLEVSMALPSSNNLGATQTQEEELSNSSALAQASNPWPEMATRCKCRTTVPAHAISALHPHADALLWPMSSSTINCKCPILPACPLPRDPAPQTSAPSKHCIPTTSRPCSLAPPRPRPSQPSSTMPCAHASPRSRAPITLPTRNPASAPPQTCASLRP